MRSQLAIRLFFLSLGMGNVSWAPMVPFIKNRLDLDHAQLGVILFLSGIGSVLCLPLSGYLIKCFGSRLVASAAGIGFLLLIPLLAMSPSLFFLGVFLLLFGISNNTMNIAINTQAVNLESQGTQSLMSGFHALFSIGNLLGILLMGTLLKLSSSLFYASLFISLVMAYTIMSQWKYLLPDTTPSSKGAKGTFDRKVIGLGLICFIAMMSEGSVLNWGAEFLTSSLQYHISHASMGYALFAIAMALGRLFGDKMVTRRGPIATFQASCILGALGFALLFSTLWPYAELIGFLLIGLGSANIIPILLSLAGKSEKMASYYALSVVTFFGFTGNFIGPLWIGFVAHAFSLALVFGLMALALLITGLLGSPFALKPKQEG